MPKNQETNFNAIKTLLEKTFYEMQAYAKCKYQIESGNLLQHLYENSDRPIATSPESIKTIVLDTFNSTCSSYSGNKADYREFLQQWLKYICSSLDTIVPSLNAQSTRGSIKWCNMVHEPTTISSLVDQTGFGEKTVNNYINKLPGIRNIDIDSKHCIYTPDREQMFERISFNSSEIGELFSCLALAYNEAPNKSRIEKIALDFYVQLTNYQKSDILPKFFERRKYLQDFCYYLEKRASEHRIKFITEQEEFDMIREKNDIDALLDTAAKHSCNKGPKISIVFKDNNNQYPYFDDCKVKFLQFDSKNNRIYSITTEVNGRKIIIPEISKEQIEDVIIIF